MNEIGTAVRAHTSSDLLNWHVKNPVDFFVDSLRTIDLVLSSHVTSVSIISVIFFTLHSLVQYSNMGITILHHLPSLTPSSLVQNPLHLCKFHHVTM